MGGCRDARPNATHEAIVRLERGAKVQAVSRRTLTGSTRAPARRGAADRAARHQQPRRMPKLQRRSDPEPHFEHFVRHAVRRCANARLPEPATISFGQNLRQRRLGASRGSRQGSDLVVALGSTLSVYPAANIRCWANRVRRM